MSVPPERIVGRETEIGALERFLDSLPAAPGALVVEGVAGIGKTTVWLEGIAAAEARSFRVLRARPAETEATLSYAALADLVEGAFDETRASLPAPQERALASALLRAEADAPADPRTTASALVGVLGALAATGPVLVALDDVQWLDRASQRALEFAARRLPPGLGLLVTRRSAAGGEAPLALGRALPEERLVRLGLGPFSVAALHQLLRRRLGATLTRPQLLRLHTASGGNPFFALELARALGPDWRPGLGGALPVPADLGELLAARVRRLPRGTREALLVAAALTRPTTALVAEADLAPAERAGIVRLVGGRVEFAHPLLAAAVYGGASSSRRRELHARLATEVEDVEERARHLGLAVTEPDEEVARTLEAGAERARARGAPEAAGELAEQAARLTPPGDPAVHGRLVRAAQRYFEGGDSTHAQGLVAEVLADTPAGPDRGAALRLLGEIRYTENSFPDAVALLEEALLHADGPRAAGPILGDLALVHFSVGDLPQARHVAAAAVEAAERLGEGPLLGEALAFDAILAFMAGDRVDQAQVERALVLEDRSRHVRLVMRPSAIAAQLAALEPRLDEARARLHELRTWAYERGEEADLPLLLGYLAGVEWRRGDYAAAAEVAEELLRIAAQLGSETWRGIGLLHRGVVSLYRGEVDRARAELGESRELMDRTGWRQGLGWALTGLGWLELAVGDHAAAADVMAPLVEAAESRGITEPWAALFAPDAVEALVALGELERAERLLDVFADRARALDRPWAIAETARCRSLLLAARGDLSGASAQAGEAVTLAEGVGMPFLLARSLLVRGRVERRARRRGAARASLERALGIFESIGTPLWAAQASSDLGRVGRRAADDELTETERRVAELAAAGRTNREVAQALFMSPKSVEANLARVYRKLGIRSRAELGARMRG